MNIRLFEIDGRGVKPTEHCHMISWLKKIIDEYPEAAAGKKDKGEIELVMTEDSDYKKDKVTEDLQKIADELGATLIKESD